MTKRERYAQVPRSVLDLSPAAIKVYVALDLHSDDAGHALVSVARLAGETSLSDRTVRRAVEQLERAGTISAGRSSFTPGVARPANTYTITHRSLRSPVPAETGGSLRSPVTAETGGSLRSSAPVPAATSDRFLRPPVAATTRHTPSGCVSRERASLPAGPDGRPSGARPTADNPYLDPVAKAEAVANFRTVSLHPYFMAERHAGMTQLPFGKWLTEQGVDS